MVEPPCGGTEEVDRAGLIGRIRTSVPRNSDNLRDGQAGGFLFFNYTEAYGKQAIKNSWGQSLNTGIKTKWNKSICMRISLLCLDAAKGSSPEISNTSPRRRDGT